MRFFNISAVFASFLLTSARFSQKRVKISQINISDHYLVKMFTQYKAAQLPTSESQSPRLSPFDELNYHSKDVNWMEIIKRLEEVNWNTELDGHSVNEMLEVLYTKSLEASKDNVPERKKKTQMPRSANKNA